MIHSHDWRIIGHGKHVEGEMFKYGTPIVTYMKCSCGQIGFRKPGSRIVYTWDHQS